MVEGEVGAAGTCCLEDGDGSRSLLGLRLVGDVLMFCRFVVIPLRAAPAVFAGA